MLHSPRAAALRVPGREFSPRADAHPSQDQRFGWITSPPNFSQKISAVAAFVRVALRRRCERIECDSFTTSAGAPFTPVSNLLSLWFLLTGC